MLQKDDLQQALVATRPDFVTFLLTHNFLYLLSTFYLLSMTTPRQDSFDQVRARTTLFEAG